MPEFTKTILSGVGPALQGAWSTKKRELETKNPAAANFLKAFTGGLTDGLRFQDESGTVTFSPQSGSITGTPSNPEGYRFSINPLAKSASVGRGSFELSGGLGNAPIGNFPGYGPTNEQLISSFSQPSQTPWGMVGFKFPAPKYPEQDIDPGFSPQPKESRRVFASPEVEKLYEQTAGPFSSGRDLYNPKSW